MASEKPKIKLNPEKRSDAITWNGVVHHTVNLEGRQIDFFQQKNGWDCGPCLCLNIQDSLQAKSNADGVTDVQKFRQWATENAALSIDYQNGSWLTFQDIYNYIKNHLGLEQKEIKKDSVANQAQRQSSGPQISLQRINNREDNAISKEQLRQDRRTRFVWGARGNHYLGYLQTQNGIYLFDSFNDSHVEKTQADLNDFIENVTGSAYVVFPPTSRITIGEQSPNNANEGSDFPQQPERINIRHGADETAASDQPAKIDIQSRTDTASQRFINKLQNIFSGR